MRNWMILSAVILAGLAAFQWVTEQQRAAARQAEIKRCEKEIARERRALGHDTELGRRLSDIESALRGHVTNYLDMMALMPPDAQTGSWARQQAERNRSAIIEEEHRRGRIAHMQSYVRELRAGGSLRPGAC
jgi:hypothetical protein